MSENTIKNIVEFDDVKEGDILIKKDDPDRRVHIVAYVFGSIVIMDFLTLIGETKKSYEYYAFDRNDFNRAKFINFI